MSRFTAGRRIVLQVTNVMRGSHRVSFIEFDMDSIPLVSSEHSKKNQLRIQSLAVLEISFRGVVPGDPGLKASNARPLGSAVSSLGF